jgi:putative FmdB family regulatory protein
MPIYAYRCTSCGHAKDVLQKISDPVLTDCPACGQTTFAKQVTAAGFQLKGSGWYVTDFRGGNSAAKGEGEGGTKDQGADKAAGADQAAAADKPTEGSAGKAAATGAKAAPAPAPAAKSAVPSTASTAPASPAASPPASGG